MLVAYGADVNLKCFGTPSLHLALTTAALPGGSEFGMKSFSLLLRHADLSSKVHIKASRVFVDRRNHLNNV
jgi:hypothetical protein